MSFLTPRLFAIAKMIEIEDVVADIGTDHAYLPIYLAKDGKAKKIYACDINENPLKVAKDNINSFGVSDKIEIVLSDGIKWVKNDTNLHINECIIAGLGSNSILNILQYDTTQIDCYIVASNTNFEPLRLWVKKNKYFIEKEILVFDSEIIYEIIKINKFAGVKIRNKKDIIFGPILRRNVNNLFIEKWIKEENKLHNLINQIPKDKKEHKKIYKKWKLIHNLTNKEFKYYEGN